MTQETRDHDSSSADGKTGHFASRFAKNHVLRDQLQELAEELEKEGDLLDSIDVDPTDGELGDGRSLTEIANDLRETAEELDRPYTIMIAGQQNAGKSTLLNTLLDEELVPMGTRNVDGLLSVFEYGDQSEAEILYEDGDREIVDEQAAFELIDQRRTEEAEQQGIDRVIFRLPEEDLQTFRFVNTPGIGSRPQVAERTRKFYSQADAVLWVFDALRIEQVQIATEVRELSRNFRQRILGVLNKCDLLDTDGCQASEDVWDKFDELFGECCSRAFPMSVRKAATSREIGHRPAPEDFEEREKLYTESGFVPLLDHFEENFFGSDLRDDKREAARRKLEAGGEEAVARITTAKQLVEDEESEKSESSDEFDRLLKEVTLKKTEVRSKLRPVAEKYTDKLIDAYALAAKRAGEDVITWAAPLRELPVGKGLSELYQEALETEREKILSDELFERQLERDAGDVIRGQWLEFEDHVAADFDIEFEGEIGGPSPGNIKVGEVVGEAIQTVLEGVLAFTARTVGKEALEEGVRKSVKKAITKAVKFVAKKIGKELTDKAVKQAAKKLSPVLWVTALADLKKFRDEMNTILQTAREDAIYEIKQQRSSLETTLVEAIDGLNDAVAHEIRDALKEKTGAINSKLDRLRQEKHRLEELANCVQALSAIQ